MGDERVEPLALGLVRRAAGGLAQASQALASTAEIEGTTRAVKVEVMAAGGPIRSQSAS